MVCDNDRWPRRNGHPRRDADTQQPTRRAPEERWWYPGVGPTETRAHTTSGPRRTDLPPLVPTNDAAVMVTMSYGVPTKRVALGGNA